jgi:hypothetical protein
MSGGQIGKPCLVLSYANRFPDNVGCVVVAHSYRCDGLGFCTGGNGASAAAAAASAACGAASAAASAASAGNRLCHPLPASSVFSVET